MTAPWVMDMKHMAELDAAEVADYARERAAAAIAADPYLLTGAICCRQDDDKLLIGLCKALSAIHAAGSQATPEQSLALCVAVQALADDESLEF